MLGLTNHPPLREARIMADDILKRCSRRREFKPTSAFQRTHGRCRACYSLHLREQYAANTELRESIKAKNRAWGAANKERKAATDKIYRAANKERCAEKGRNWRIANQELSNRQKLAARHRDLETYRAREAAYREQNRAACNARIKEWKGRNPHATVAYAGKRRAAELRAIPLWADLDAIAAIYRQAQTLGTGYHVDHAVPLISEFVCGLHCEANLQILTASENARKNNRRWPDMWGEA